MKRFILLMLLLLGLVAVSCSYMPDGAAVSVIVKQEADGNKDVENEVNLGDTDQENVEPDNSQEVDNTVDGNDQENPEENSSLGDDENSISDSETENLSGEDLETDGDADSENQEEKEPAEDTEPILQPSDFPDDEPGLIDIENDSQMLVKERQWSILLYMCGDNNLESAAINDLLEMEKSKIDTDVVSIFALVDRSNSYNTSNQNWTGTRLYKIKTGSSKDSKELISERIDCKNLDLHADVETELDMSSSYVLSSSLSYIMERYPADHYGLIVWGHGTGWRGDINNQLPEEESGSGWKGFAYDETSGTYMTLNQFGTGLKNCLDNKILDFIGFDTCYGGEIEIMYEIKDYAKYGIGTEGLVASDGWNYETLFNQFSEWEELSTENFCNSVVRQFKDSYTGYNRASIAVVNLEVANDYVLAFNNYCAAVADKITNIDIHENIMGVLYDNENCKTEKYTYGRAGYDIYLDVNSIVENLQSYFVSAKNSSDLVNLYSIFKTAAQSLYYLTWASDRATGGLGVYFSTLTQGCYLSTNHPSAYISGKTYNQIQFVKNCTGYVPAAKNGKGLLDKLFYTSF